MTKFLETGQKSRSPAPVRNVRLVVEYDGTDYFGFQRIPGRKTIQGEIEWALTRITEEPVIIAGAGRTDAGVHALGQVVSFQSRGKIPIERIAIALNSVLPNDIVIRSAEEMPEEFHARFSAVERAYQYTILNRSEPAALIGRFSWHVPYELSLKTMRKAAKNLVGVHDYLSFSAADSGVRGHTREIKELSVRRSGEFVKIDIVANAFLRSMARIIVGTLVEVGQGRREAANVNYILEARDRRLAGRTAPAKGLVLMGVKY